MSEQTVDYKRILDKIEEDLLNDDIIKDNKLHFMHENELYIVEMPSQRVLSNADRIKSQKYVELIQQPNTVTEKKLIKILKENQDIDIDTMQKEVNDIEKKLKEEYLNLYSKRDNQEERIKEIEDKIDSLKADFRDKNLEIAEHLASSIETQIKNVYMEYLTAFCTKKYIEKKKDDKVIGEYVNVWNSFEEYADDTSSLRYEAIGYLTHLMMNIRD